MAAQGLHPPDLIDIGKSHAVHFVSAIFFKQRCSAKYTFPRTANIGQHYGDKVLFANTACLLRDLTISGFIDNERISAENALVGSDGLRRSHGYICCIDAGASPDTFIGKDVGNCGIAHGLVGKFDFDMTYDRTINVGLLIRRDDDQLLRCIPSGGRIVVAGDHSRAVVGCFSASEQCCTGHFCYLFQV